MSHANYRHLAPRYIVKCRDRVQWETETYKGVRRRIQRWGPWVGVLYGLTEHRAREEVERRMKTGLSEWAVFFNGKRLVGDPEPKPDNFPCVEAFERAVDQWEQRHGYR